MSIADSWTVVKLKVALIASLLAAGLGAFVPLHAAAPPTTAVVQAPDSPIRLDKARILNPGEDPPVLLYGATNLTNDQIDTLTVMVFVFRQGVLKARQVAPARHELGVHETKFSAMVLDGYAIEPGDLVVVGVNQVQRVGSEQWWRADLQSAAEEAAKRQKP